MSRDRESFPEKLKRWFTSGGATAAPSNAIVLTDELKVELSRTSPLPKRLSVIAELAELLTTSKLAKNGIEEVWCLVKDLLDVLEVPPTCRRTTLRMLTNYATGETDTDYMRMVFIKHIKWCYSQEEPEPLFKFFRAVLMNGRQIKYVEEEVGLLLARWLPRLLSSPVSTDALQITINLVKFHSAYVDDTVASAYIREAINKMHTANDEDEVLLCLSLVETVIAYRYLPIQALSIALTGLCRIVNVPHLTGRVVKIVKDVLGTCVGSSAYDTLISMIDSGGDVQLVASAMFFASYVTWGVNRMSSLNSKKVYLIRSIYGCMSDESDMSREVLVLYEVALSLQRLLTDLQPKLNAQSWNLFIEIMIPLYRNTERIAQNDPRSSILGVLRDIMNRLEYFVDSNAFEGNVDKFYKLLDYVSHHRPQSSIFKAIDYWKKSATPPGLDWVPNLITLVKRYFIGDIRPHVNMRALDVLKDIYTKHMDQHGRMILEAVVAELFVGFERMPCMEVRTHVVHFLVLVGMGEKCDAVEEVIKLLGAVIMIKYRLPNPPELTPEEAVDITTAVEGLVKIFRKKTWQFPPKIAVSAYNILLTLLENHYKKPKMLQKVSQTRLKVFEMMFSMMCDDENHIGFSLGEVSAVEVRNMGIIAPFSPYVVVSPKGRHSQELQEENTGTEDVSVLSLGDMGEILLIALQSEKDWVVLELLLRELAQKLHQKTIVLALMNERMDSLTSTLCKMACDPSLNFPSCLSNFQDKFSRSEFESKVYPVLAVLVAHKKYIKPITQQQLIRSLQLGIINRYSAQLCIEAITLCVVEMPQAMGKQITRIVNHFAKITQSVSHSQAMLEFLSTLLHFPSMYYSFVLPQYMSIFAIAIPYTNPFKFNHYIVSLAFHVIAMWFLKCHLPFRKNVVRYITNNLNKKLEYLTTTFKPKATPGKRGKLNRKEKTKEKERLEEEERNKSKIQIFTDLMETCIDLMSRYVFAYCRPITERSGMVEMLMEQGKSHTWIAGNKLITITTSGCAGRMVQTGLCDVCHRLCRKGVPNLKKVDMDQIGSRDEVDVSNAKVPAARTSHKASPDSALSSPCSPSRQSSTIPRTPPLTCSQRYPRTQLSFFSPSSQPSSSTKSSPSSSSACPSFSITQPSLSPTRSLSTHPSPSDHPSPSTQPSPSDHPSSSTQPSPSDHSSPSTQPSLSDHPTPSTQPSLSSQSCPSSPSLQPAVSPQHLSSQTSPSAMQSPSTPSTPQSPYFPFTHYPEYSPVQSSPDTSLGLSLTSESSQGLSRDCSPEKLVSQRTPSPQAPQESERKLLSRDNLHLPLAHLKRPPGQNINTHEVDGGKQGWPRGHHERTLPQQLPPVPEDVGASGDLLPQDVQSAGARPRPHLCACWCQGWAELYMRQPCGNFSAIIKIQNDQFADAKEGFPLHEMSDIISPSETKEHYSKDVMELRDPVPDTFKDTASDVTVVAVGQEVRKQGNEASASPSYQGTTSPSCQGTASPSCQGTASPSCQGTASPSCQGTASPSCQRTASPSCQRTASPSCQRTASPSCQRTASTSEGSRSPKKGSTRVAAKNIPKWEERGGGMPPSFVFLQLYYQGLMPTDDSRPILLPTDQTETLRSIRLLDLIKPYDTHKIGVLYVRHGQTTEQEILSNSFGSLRYNEFLSALGSYVELAKGSQQVFLGGLDTKGVDGDNALVWHDDLMQVVFHVATMMPTRVSDPRCNGKKRHIGNNYVTVVYNDCGQPYNINTIKGQFNHIVIEIVPNHKDTNTVKLHYQLELLNYLRSSSPRLVSKSSLPMLVRQMAVHSDLAAKIVESLQRPPHHPFANNWVERLRHIRRIHSTVLGNIRKSEERFSAPELNDFSDLIDVTVRNRELSKSGQYSIQLMY